MIVVKVQIIIYEWCGNGFKLDCIRFDSLLVRWKENIYFCLKALFRRGATSSTVFIVCVTEQHYVSIFFTRLWSVRKPRLFNTQNPEISGFSTAHAYKYKTKRLTKMKRGQRKMPENDIFVD